MTNPVPPSRKEAGLLWIGCVAVFYCALLTDSRHSYGNASDLATAMGLQVSARMAALSTLGLAALCFLYPCAQAAALVRRAPPVREHRWEAGLHWPIAFYFCLFELAILVPAVGELRKPVLGTRFFFVGFVTLVILAMWLGRPFQ